MNEFHSSKSPIAKLDALTMVIAKSQIGFASAALLVS
jgi:hypothetical protein